MEEVRKRERMLERLAVKLFRVIDGLAWGGPTARIDARYWSTHYGKKLKRLKLIKRTL